MSVARWLTPLRRCWRGACQHVRMHLDSRTAQRMWPPILGWEKAVTVTLVAFIVLDLTAARRP